MRSIVHFAPGFAVTCFAAVVLASFADSARAQNRPPSCTAPEHRQFDFWIGEWEVKTPDGRVAGTSRIERIAGGCALLESWRGAGGSVGTSINFWSPEDRQWHQTWAGSGGSFLFLAGARTDSAMSMTGTTRDTSGAAIREHITWSLLPDGSVRQHWRQSRDDGKSWTDSFVGIYRRRKS